MMSYHLFYKPGWEIDEGTDVSVQQLQELSRTISSRLNYAASLTEDLEQLGFIPYMGLYEIQFDHKEYETEEEVRKVLEKNGFDVSEFEIY